MTKTIEDLAGNTPEPHHVDINSWPGRMLFFLRENMGYSQSHVSEKLGIPVERIAAFETGKTPMSSEAISKAATFFAVLPSAFFKEVNLLDEVGDVLDRVAFDYEFEQMLCRLTEEQRRSLLNVAGILF